MIVTFFLASVFLSSDILTAPVTPVFQGLLYDHRPGFALTVSVITANLLEQHRFPDTETSA